MCHHGVSQLFTVLPVQQSTGTAATAAAGTGPVLLLNRPRNSAQNVVERQYPCRRSTALVVKLQVMQTVPTADGAVRNCCVLA